MIVRYEDASNRGWMLCEASEDVGFCSKEIELWEGSAVVKAIKIQKHRPSLNSTEWILLEIAFAFFCFGGNEAGGAAVCPVCLSQ